MASRLRERRRVTPRAPGILRGPVPAGSSPDRVATQHGARRWGGIRWRLVSASIVLCLSLILVLFFSFPFFYVRSIAVAGLKYITKEEVFALTGIANMHIFWVDPAEVRRNILRSPTLADASVQVGWPPNMIQIVVEERQPALTWEQSGVAVWVDVQGRVMRQREDRTDLLRILSEENDGPMGQNVNIGLDVVTGALQLKALYPNIESLRYNPIKGLGYQDGRGWMVWFGVGTDMPEKTTIYNAIVANLLSRGIQPGEIHVTNPDAPYYTVQLGR